MSTGARGFLRCRGHLIQERLKKCLIVFGRFNLNGRRRSLPDCRACNVGAAMRFVNGDAARGSTRRHVVSNKTSRRPCKHRAHSPIWSCAGECRRLKVATPSVNTGRLIAAVPLCRINRLRHMAHTSFLGATCHVLFTKPLAAGRP